MMLGDAVSPEKVAVPPPPTAGDNTRPGDTTHPKQVALFNQSINGQASLRYYFLKLAQLSSTVKVPNLEHPENPS